MKAAAAAAEAQSGAPVSGLPFQWIADRRPSLRAAFPLVWPMRNDTLGSIKDGVEKWQQVEESNSGSPWVTIQNKLMRMSQGSPSLCFTQFTL